MRIWERLFGQRSDRYGVADHRPNCPYGGGDDTDQGWVGRSALGWVRASLDRGRHHVVVDDALRPLDRCGRDQPARLHLRELAGVRHVVGNAGIRGRESGGTASASATAKLIPTPPTGDIACAASPITNNPSLYHLRSRFNCTSSSFTSSNEVRAGPRVASQGTRAVSERRAGPPLHRPASARHCLWR